MQLLDLRGAVAKVRVVASPRAPGAPMDATAPGLARPLPVIMMAGVAGWTGQWKRVAAGLERDGLDVYVLRAPLGGWGGLDRDVQALRDAIHAVREMTGAEQVRLVGHSKGGVAAVEAARMEAQHVDRVVTISSPHGGVGPTWASRLVDLIPFAPQVLRDLARGSEALRGQRADTVDVVSIHHDRSDGLISARAATVLGDRAHSVSFAGGGWRSTHPFNVSHHEAVFNALRAALVTREFPARAAAAAGSS